MRPVITEEINALPFDRSYTKIKIIIKIKVLPFDVKKDNIHQINH